MRNQFPMFSGDPPRAANNAGRLIHFNPSGNPYDSGAVTGFVFSITQEALGLLSQMGARYDQITADLLAQYFQEIWEGFDGSQIDRKAIAADAARATIKRLPGWIGRTPLPVEQLAWGALFMRAGLWNPSDEGGGFMQALKGLGEGLRGITQSPLWKAVAIAVNVVPGLGTAISAGMLAATAVGKATSVEDAVIGAGREALPGGEEAKAGYDAATGILIQGKPIDQVGLDFVKSQLEPGPARDAFDYAMSIQVGIRANAQIAPGASPDEKVAAYAAAGQALSPTLLAVPIGKLPKWTITPQSQWSVAAQRHVGFFGWLKHLLGLA